jgi:hypothetical protein
VLRITTTTGKGSAALKLEGKIAGPWVEELRQSWKAVVSGGRNGQSVKVDMRGVSYVDRLGADLLGEMEAAGGSLVHCSDFIRQLLQANGDSKKTTRRNIERAKEEKKNASTVRS